MSTNANESAFPEITTARAGSVHTNDVYGETYSYGGLTKREYFAAMAMQGMLANNNSELTRAPIELMADLSVKQADALIAALNKI